MYDSNNRILDLCSNLKLYFQNEAHTVLENGDGIVYFRSLHTMQVLF
jgi:hypothetical protein